MSVKLTYEYYTVVSSATVTVNKIYDDYFIDATNNNVALTLPAASSTGLKGKIFTFRRIDTSTNTVTISANGTDTIEGLSSIVLDLNHTEKLMRYTSTSWKRIMETKKLLSTNTYASNASIDPSLDVVQVNTAGGNVTVTLPAASTVSLGQRYVAVCTSNLNTGSVAPNGTDTINGVNSSVSLVQNVGKTFFTVSSTAWRQF